MQKLSKSILIFLMSGLFLTVSVMCSKLDFNKDPISEVEVHLTSSSDAFHLLSKSTYNILFYKDDTLYLEKRINSNIERFALPIGEYDVLILDRISENIDYKDFSTFSRAKISIRNSENKGTMINHYFLYTHNTFKVKPNSLNRLEAELKDVVKKIDYQLEISGLCDSLIMCNIVQSGLAKGIEISTKAHLFQENYVEKIQLENSDMTLSGSLYSFGINPEVKTTEIEFVFNDNKVQTAIVDVLTDFSGDINYKKVMLYVDISFVNLELKAMVKSWVIIEDHINM